MMGQSTMRFLNIQSMYSQIKYSFIKCKSFFRNTSKRTRSFCASFRHCSKSIQFIVFFFCNKGTKMRMVFVKFREITQKYPIVRGMVSYAAIWPAGCLLQQKITGKKEFDYGEAVRFSLYGTFYVAPTLYCWLRFASYLWPKNNLKSAITKVNSKKRNLNNFVT